MKKLFSFFVLSLFATAAWGYSQRDLLVGGTSPDAVKASLVMNQKWVPYPSYADRAGWAKMTEGYAADLVAAGEKALAYEWKVVPAMAFVEYERSGNRNVMEKPYGDNITALGALFYAELAEGKGRFIEKMVDGVWATCEMTSWGLSAHLAGVDRRRPLPRPDYEIIELMQSDVSTMLSWIYYYFAPSFNQIDPLIATRLRSELQRRMLDSYMVNSNFWWQAFNATPTTMVNNWNPWCNFNVLMCYMLLENDRDKLAAAVWRTMGSVDKYINYSKQDGACEEGPSYWGHAAGKMYDYLQALYDITGGKVTVFADPQIKAMGEYIVRSYVGEGWVVNFADASAKGGGEGEIIYRYGKAVASPMMMNYGAVMSGKKEKVYTSRDVFRTLQGFLYHNELSKYQTTQLNPSSIWYPQTEFCFVNDTKTGFFLAAKGGFNNESHNHNDAGTFSVYLNSTPILIDAGVGTYTRQTFSSERYSIWTMQSDYHNVPKINGYAQPFGGEYKATEAQFNPKTSTLSLELAKAYPIEAGVKSYVRTYAPTKTGIKVSDRFSIDSPSTPNQLNFLTWGAVNIATPGKVLIDVKGQKAMLEYDAKQFDASVQTVKLDDPRLSNVWGPEIYRVSLDAKQTAPTGTYTFTIKKQ